MKPNTSLVGQPDNDTIGCALKYTICVFYCEKCVVIDMCLLFVNTYGASRVVGKPGRAFLCGTYLESGKSIRGRWPISFVMGSKVFRMARKSGSSFDKNVALPHASVPPADLASGARRKLLSSILVIRV